MEELKNYIHELQEIKSQFKLKELSDDVLFESAIKLFISQTIQSSKDRHIENYKKDKQEDFNKITEKQKFFLAKIGISREEILKLNKQSASEIIKNYKENQGKGENY